MFISFALTKFVLQIPFLSKADKNISYAAVFIEMLCFLLFKLFGPKIKSARMISGILLLIGSLTLLFTSFGYGIIIYSIAISACFMVSIGNRSKFLGIALLPMMCPQIYIILLIHLIDGNIKIDINEILGNYYITLFIYPTILLLCCQDNSFISK